jgi:hypothetical protein
LRNGREYPDEVRDNYVVTKKTDLISETDRRNAITILINGENSWNVCESRGGSQIGIPSKWEFPLLCEKFRKKTIFAQQG